MNEPSRLLEGQPSRSGVYPLARLGHTSTSPLPSPSERSQSSACRQSNHAPLNDYKLTNAKTNYVRNDKLKQRPECTYAYKKNIAYLNESSESSNSENVSGLPYRSSFSRTDCTELSSIAFHTDCWDRDTYPMQNANGKYLTSQDTSQTKYLDLQSPSTQTNYLFDHFGNVNGSSPNLDHGYHTLVSASPAGLSPMLWNNTQLFKLKKLDVRNNSFDRLGDALVVRIFSFLSSVELSVCARVCRRFDILAWTPALWRTLTLQGERISGDRAIRGVLRQLCGQGRTGACPNVERVHITEGAKLTDRGLVLLARRCPELTRLQIQASSAITNNGLYEITTKCHHLQHLDVSGCMQISCVTPGSNATTDPTLRLQLQYLDLTDCATLQDSDLRIILRNCPQLAFLYLRRCVNVTDTGLKSIPSYCCGIRELSVSDCTHITDFGLYELAKLGATLRYLSVAKCDQVSDAGLKVIAKRCYKLRYLNVRGCEAVSDDAITILAKSCTRLRALDIGKCDVSDAGLRVLAESCPNLKKLSLRNCDLVTDKGVHCIAYYCRGLQQLNIQDCQISLEGYRAVKKFCKRCVIEHTNPGFF